MKSARKLLHYETAVPAVEEFTPPGLSLGWRIILTLLLLLLVALLSLLLQRPQRAEAAPLAQSTGDPLVLAFYYTWYDSSTWSLDRLSDLPAQPYTSSDRAAMGRHIDEAKAAGIDAFLVAWYGPTGDSNQTEANLSALLDEAAARNFKIGILFETNSPFLGSTDAVISAVRHALSVHANHPAFLRADGKPVIFFWRPSLYAGAWEAVRSQADPDHAALWIGEGTDTSQLAVFDGQFLYSNTWNPPADLTAVNQKFARLVDAARQSTGAPKLWVATVMPGYDDTRIRPNSGFARDRADGDYYAQSWQAAIASHPTWIVITSFNEWPEGTFIEPSAASGDRYLGLTAQWSGQFKAGGSAPSAAAVAEAPATTPAPTDPTAFVTAALLNLRGGPGIDYAVVGRVGQGTVLRIVGHSKEQPIWWQVESDVGAAWVSGELVDAEGPLDTVPAVAVDPPAAATPAPAATPSDATPEPAQSPAAPSLTLTIGNQKIQLRPATPLP